MENKNSQIVSAELSLGEVTAKIKKWFSYLLSKWYVILIFGLIGALLGMFYAKQNKPIYTATTTFVLESGESNTGSLGQMAGLAALAGIDFGSSTGGIFQGDNLLELYRSRKMIEAALYSRTATDTSVSMIEKYLDVAEVKERWKKKKPELLEISFKNIKQKSSSLQRAKDSVMESVVANIRDKCLVVDKLDKKLSIIRVEVKSNDESFSKDFNDALVKNVNDFYVTTKTKKSQDNIKILQHKTDSVRGVMTGAITSAAIVIDNTPNLNPTKQAQRIIPTQRSQFSAETNKAILSQLIQHLEMAKMALLRETPLIQVIDEPILPLKKQFMSIYKGLIFGVIIGVMLSLFFMSITFVIKRMVR